MEMYPDDTPIYTDNEHAATLSDRVTWISRKLNKDADAAANLRNGRDLTRFPSKG